MKIRREGGDQVISTFDLLREHFTKSKGLYFLILFTFLPFIAIRVNAILLGRTPFFYLVNPSFWTLFLDIYNEFLNFFILYQLALLLWMMFNISWLLSKLNNKLYYYNLKIAPLESDKMGGLRIIRDLILKLSLYYFLAIILVAFTYITPRGPLLFENVSLVLFWLVGVTFSLMAWLSLRKLLKGKIENDVSSLNDVLEDKRLQLINLITNNKEQENEDQMDSLSKSLDIIYKERDRIIGFKVKPIDARTIILFISSSLLSLIAIVKTIEQAFCDAQNSRILMLAVNHTQPFFNDTINVFAQYFIK